MWQRLIAVFCCLTALAVCGATADVRPSPARSFAIDYGRNGFVKDGEPFRYVSGDLHYYRVPSIYWRDRMLKMKAAGLNAIQFYIPWNYHEPTRGTYDFTAPEKDIGAFIALAQQLGFVVLLRTGPYICSEWENGGLPWWLIKGDQNKDIKMRTYDKRFLVPMKRWFDTLFPLLVPHLYKNGGPIVMIAVENEYGSYHCDVPYTAYLRDLIRSYVGYDTVLYSVDGGALSYLKCGYIPDVYPTVDFGAGGTKTGFDAQRVYAPRGPLVNSEYYTGRLDLWGTNHSVVSAESVTQSIEQMWHYNASFNMYMFAGGTNFQFWAGAEIHNPIVTSYDFNAPISESGDLTDKYWKIREKLKSLVPWHVPLPPGNSTKMAYGNVKLKCRGSIFDHLHKLSPPSARVQSAKPMNFEQLDHPYGFVLYETVLGAGRTASNVLSAPALRDRAFVLVNGQTVGLMFRRLGDKTQTNITLPSRLTAGTKLQVLVENEGRQTYETIIDHKGLGQVVTLNNEQLLNWTNYKVLLDRLFIHTEITDPLAQNTFASCANLTSTTSMLPIIFSGIFKAAPIADTFMNPIKWGRGHYFINGFHAGRYWPSLGPQVTMFTPKNLVHRKNLVTLVEFEHADCNAGKCSINFDDKPFLDKIVR